PATIRTVRKGRVSNQRCSQLAGRIESTCPREINRSVRTLFLLIPLECALAPVLFDGLRTLGAADEFAAISVGKFEKEDTVGFRVRRITRDRHAFAGLD